ncbi:TauD/TfdA family dioxygenase [Streptomyces violaceorubidus]|uniref:TauD/TfdA family dioxygenase n=1 Tax=Streptomyces violaceorubidus TaxID=284042 RepID=UPI0004BFBEAF|nr:TauD/TfdA family dioxygenase [Streptomyces violaceorubidus]
MRFLTEVAEQAAGDTVGAVATALAGHKVVTLRRTADVDGDSFYRELAGGLGEFHFRDEDPVTGRLDTAGWLDIRYDPELETRSRYRYGNDRMPLHTDGAYSDVDFDVFFLRCHTSARFGGATFAVDGATVVEYLEVTDPDLLHALLSTDVRFVKGERSVSRRIISHDDDGPVFNWSSTRVAEDNAAGVIDMCDRFTDFCERQLVDGGLVQPLRLAPGDAVFLHNRRVLHGRYGFWGARCLLKGVLNLNRSTAGRAGTNTRPQEGAG